MVGRGRERLGPWSLCGHCCRWRTRWSSPSGTQLRRSASELRSRRRYPRGRLEKHGGRVCLLRNTWIGLMGGDVDEERIRAKPDGLYRKNKKDGDCTKTYRGPYPVRPTPYRFRPFEHQCSKVSTQWQHQRSTPSRAWHRPFPAGIGLHWQCSARSQRRAGARGSRPWCTCSCRTSCRRNLVRTGLSHPLVSWSPPPKGYTSGSNLWSASDCHS